MKLAVLWEEATSYTSGTRLLLDQTRPCPMASSSLKGFPTPFHPPDE